MGVVPAATGLGLSLLTLQGCQELLLRFQGGGSASERALLPAVARAYLNLIFLKAEGALVSVGGAQESEADDNFRDCDRLHRRQRSFSGSRRVGAKDDSSENGIRPGQLRSGFSPEACEGQRRTFGRS